MLKSWGWGGGVVGWWGGGGGGGVGGGGMGWGGVGGWGGVVAHVIIVSAQVLLVLTLGLWTLGLRTDNFRLFEV